MILSAPMEKNDLPELSGRHNVTVGPIKFPQLALVFAAGWLLSLPVLADLVVMKNGDRISGEIQEIWDMDVVIEPAYDDDVNVSIALKNVAYIESEREFEVTMADGRDVIARLVGKGVGDKQKIEIDGEVTSITFDQLEELDEIKDYFDWDSRIDFNFTLNKGNTDSLNTRLFGETNLKLGDHRHIADATFTREEQDRITTRESDLLRYSYNWLFNDPWFLGGSASFERDPIRDLDHRFIVGATIGRDIWNKPRRAMNVQAGLGYLTEESSPTDVDGNPLPKETNESVAVLWAFRFRQDLIGDDLEVYHNNSVNWNITGRTNGSIKTVTGVRYEITDLLYLNASVNFDWETEPAGDAENEDLAVVIGLGVEF
jgi:putative salt-induced outer membrane protein YdiY